MRRYPSTSYASTFSFGPGPLSTLLKALIAINVAMFVVQLIEPGLTRAFGLRPADVIERFRVWQLATYMFLHGGVFHLLFNMLALWMFGTELERMWGTRYFLKYYLVTGIGAGALTVLVSLPSNEVSAALYPAVIIGASGAIYGLLLAFALYFPDRPIYLYMVFPIPAKYFVMIIGALAFYSSLGQSSGVASATHLGGLLVGYLYLKNGRMQPLGELKYRYLKWKMNRARRKFDVYSGGRANDYDRRIH
jgi:membrane associated rhomboid family serine protease